MSDNEYQTWVRDTLTGHGEILTEVRVAVGQMGQTVAATQTQMESLEGRVGSTEKSVERALFPGKVAAWVVKCSVGLSAVAGLVGGIAHILGLWPAP